MYEIELDNFKKYKLYDDIILKYELLIDRRITEKKLEQVVNENNFLDAYYQALKYINVKMRCEYEIRVYLKKKGFNVFDADYVVSRLKDEGYINERAYVQAYINDAINLGLYGPKKISDNLRKLGLDEMLVNEYLECINSREWLNRINKILEKKARVNKSSEKMFKNKVTADLLNLGYYYDDIKILVDDFSIDTEDAFLKEANKTYDKLSCKFEGTELILRFKQKMYSKGFDGDCINGFLDKKN